MDAGGPRWSSNRAAALGLQVAVGRAREAHHLGQRGLEAEALQMLGGLLRRAADQRQMMVVRRGALADGGDLSLAVALGEGQRPIDEIAQGVEQLAVVPSDELVEIELGTPCLGRDRREVVAQRVGAKAGFLLLQFALNSR